MINYNDISFTIDVNSVNNNDDDYCTIIQSSNGNPSSFGIYAHRCDDGSIRGYPLCRLLRIILFSLFFIKIFFFFLNLASHQNEDNHFIYRLETDTQPGNLTGVMDFCFELGGYPIYANNAYEWQLIQGSVFKPSFIYFIKIYFFRNNVKRSKF